MTAKSIGFPYVHLSPLSSLLADDIFDGVLHLRFKKFYFIHHKWPQGWIDEAMEILQSIWARYRPAVPLASKPPVLPIAAPVTAGLNPKKSQVNFDIVLDYGHQVYSGLDALEEYLRAPPLPHLMDPLGYWLKQQKAGEAMGDASNTVLAQMALDYLSVPGLFFRFLFTQAVCILFLISFFIS